MGTKKRDSWIFLGGIFLRSIFEYACSWIQEGLFGTVSWQYDKMPLNLHGRIHLLYSMFWGILAVVWVKELYLLMCRWMGKIPNKVAKPLTWVLTVFMIINTVMSGIAIGQMEIYEGKDRREMQKENELLNNLDKLHTTEMGIERIKKNLKSDIDDMVAHCKDKVSDKNCNIYKQGKNWYCEIDNIRITINSHSYTMITAHLMK